MNKKDIQGRKAYANVTLLTPATAASTPRFNCGRWLFAADSETSKGPDWRSCFEEWGGGWRGANACKATAQCTLTNTSVLPGNTCSQPFKVLCVKSGLTFILATFQHTVHKPPSQILNYEKQEKSWLQKSSLPCAEYLISSTHFLDAMTVLGWGAMREFMRGLTQTEPPGLQEAGKGHLLTWQRLNSPADV